MLTLGIGQLHVHHTSLVLCPQLIRNPLRDEYKQGCAPQKGDVLIAKDGNSALDTVCVYNQDDEIVLLSSVAILRPSKLITSDFLNYFLDSPITRQNLKDNFRSGSAIPRVVLKDFRRYPISIPSLEVQSKIGSYLRALDDKIELNRQLNATLEQLARSLFQSWFVDFDSVRAKASGEPDDSICRRLGLTPELLALFPAALEESKMGEIPAGWEIRKAEEVVRISIGKTPPRKESEWFSEDAKDVAWVSIRDMGNSGVFLAQTSEFLTEAAINKHNVKLVPADTVLLSFKLTVGRVAITNREMATNEAIAHFNITKNSPLSSSFLYLYLKQFDYSSLGSTSSIATAVNSQSIKGIPIICPAKQIAQAFQRITSGFFEAIHTHEAESRTLAALRDELLPKLLSGQLKLSTSN